MRFTDKRPFGDKRAAIPCDQSLLTLLSPSLYLSLTSSTQTPINRQQHSLTYSLFVEPTTALSAGTQTVYD